MALFVAALVLLVAAAYGQDDLNIVPAVRDLLIKEGVPQNLVCTTKYAGSFRWEHAMQGQRGFSQTSQYIDNDSKQETVLKIANFSAAYAGDYVCKVIAKDGIYTETISLVLVTETKTEPAYHFGNKTAKLACSIAVEDNTIESVTWLREGQPVSSLPGSERFVEQADNYSLTINDPKQEDVGVYTAEIKLDKIATPYRCDVEYKKAVLQITAIKVEPTYHPDNDTAVLSCNINAQGRTIKNVQWFKNDTSILKLEESERFKDLSENNTLIIDAPTPDDAGLYIARFHLVGEMEPYNCQVMFKAPPSVRKFKKSKNLMEKDNLELQCQVSGYPPALVFWYKDGTPLNVSTDGEGDSRVHLHTLKGYKDARLVIKDVAFGDAGEYSCKAYSAFFNESSTETITVRVKDKLAALWPFLGIVFEVIVLCTIIFLYERRRNKLAEQEERNAHEAEPAMEKKDGLRHRNTPGNPTA